MIELLAAHLDVSLIIELSCCHKTECLGKICYICVCVFFNIHLASMRRSKVRLLAAQFNPLHVGITVLTSLAYLLFLLLLSTFAGWRAGLHIENGLNFNRVLA